MDTSLVISILALIISVFFARRQLGATRASDTVDITLQLLTEYRGQELKTARRRVYALPAPAAPNPKLALLAEEDRLAAEMVSHYFDHIGLLVVHRLVPVEPVIAFFGSGAILIWQQLEPYIRSERVARGLPQYQAYFEALVKIAVMRDPNRVVAHAVRDALRPSATRRLMLILRG